MGTLPYISTTLPVSRGVQRVKEIISPYGVKFKAGILMRERERDRETTARERGTQSDGDDSLYCVFIVSSMYNKVIFNT